MKQELRIKLDMSITVDCKHTAAELAAMVERGVRASFPNNPKRFHSLRMAEEAAIYSKRRDRITWTPIIKPLAFPKV